MTAFGTSTQLSRGRISAALTSLRVQTVYYSGLRAWRDSLPAYPHPIVAFHIGAKGRTARFETPPGPVTMVVFEYRDAEVASGRATFFEQVAGTLVLVEGKSVGVIIDPKDQDEAERLLRRIDYVSNQEAVSWDPRFWTHDALTLEGGIGMVLAGALAGAHWAVPRFVLRWRNGIPEILLGLRIQRPSLDGALPEKPR